MKRILIAAFVAIFVLAVAAFSVTPVQAGNINNNPFNYGDYTSHPQINSIR